MITIDCEQGTLEWRQARIGIPTASQFYRLLTPKTRKASAQAFGYRHELLASWLLGEDVEGSGGTGFMERGTDMEAEACAYYEFTEDCVVDHVGFCLRDDRVAGCSPDGLIGDDGGLEIKCMSAANHIAALLNPPDPTEHICQIQGSLWVTGRQWWDRIYYHPEFPKIIVRIERDADFIAALSTEVERFFDSVADGKEKLLAMGCEPRSLLEAV